MTTPVERVIVEADGGSRGNPGPAGYGALVRDPATGAVLAERSTSLGVTTNNVAEYSGLIAGLEAAAELGARSVEVRMDSKLVIEQMSGRWQIKHPGLRPLAARAARLVRDFDRVEFGWIPRSRNAHADRLANEAMDAAAATGRRGTPGRGAADRATGGAADRATGGAADRATGGAADRAAGGAADRAAGGAAATRARPAVPMRGSWDPPTGTPTRLLLVRHGATELTAQGRYSGRGDVPLSDRGARQAVAVADRIAGLVRADTAEAGRLAPQVAVLTSPLRRCVATAEAVAAALGGVPVRPEPGLIECDFGDWEGRTFAEIRENWPAELAAWQSSPYAAPPGGEPLRAVEQRMRDLVRDLLPRYPEHTLVLVSHVSPIKALLREALDAGDGFLYRLHLAAAGLSIMDMWPDGLVSVRTVNETGHLQDT